MQVKSEIEVWGGIEYTLNRIRDEYHDQLEYTGHYYRDGDIDTIASLGIKALRYPILWERHQPQEDTTIDWSFSEKNLLRLQAHGIDPIAGLVHHGSGPRFVNFFDGSFEQGLTDYAAQVAEKFPWIRDYTPVNEPLTTARFCGLYGFWYPHTNDELSFYRILLSECRATVMAMQAIRKVNPAARLIQTEDLGKTYSTPLLQYQADFDNHRRWLSFDLLCGKVDEQHPLWNYLTQKVGLAAEELHYFVHNPCVPDICGLNYYMTSERYLDDDCDKYPQSNHSGNGRHRFADLERVRIPLAEDFGAHQLLKEAYEHLHLPIAVTECHLHCTRDEQMRWFKQMWHTVNALKGEGIDIRAITAWALFGTYGWDKLMMEPRGNYETGAFKVTTGYPQPTAFARLLQSLTGRKAYHHPVLKYDGWWKRDLRCFYTATEDATAEERGITLKDRPLLITGEKGALNTGLQHICYERNMPFVLVSNEEADLNNQQIIDDLLQKHTPWAVIHVEGYNTTSSRRKWDQKQTAPTGVNLATACKQRAIKFVCFSPEPTEHQTSELLYGEENESVYLCIYSSVESGREKAILQANTAALIIRSGKLFSPWERSGFINRAIASLQQDEGVNVSTNVYSSFTYVPDVAHIGLDWLLDNEAGVFSMINSYSVSEAYLVSKAAEWGSYNKSLVQDITKQEPPARRIIQFLSKERRVKLPYLEDALRRYVEAVTQIQPEKEAVLI